MGFSPFRSVPALPWSTTLLFPHCLCCSLLLSPPHHSLHVPSLSFFSVLSQSTLWIGSAVSCSGSVVKSAGTRCVWHGTAPGLFSRKPPLSPSATKPLPFTLNATANSERKHLSNQIVTKGQNMSKSM